MCHTLQRLVLSPTTTQCLEGMVLSDLNVLLSDTLWMFPQECEPLMDLVSQHMMDNTIFVLEFLRSLVERGLLGYDTGERCWTWDKDHFGAVDVTANVLYLLSSKMRRLSETTQSALNAAV